MKCATGRQGTTRAGMAAIANTIIEMPRIPMISVEVRLVFVPEDDADADSAPTGT